MGVAGFDFQNEVLIDLIDQISPKVLIVYEFFLTIGVGNDFQVNSIRSRFVGAHESLIDSVVSKHLHISNFFISRKDMPYELIASLWKPILDLFDSKDRIR